MTISVMKKMVKSVCSALDSVEEVWDIGEQGLGNILGLKTHDAIAIKEAK